MKLLPGIVLVVALVCPAAALAQWRESFETADPTWRLAEQNVAAEIVGQRRVFEGAQAGNGCEYLRLAAGQGGGAKVYLAHPIAPARAIAELRPSLWVRADRSGLQLFARVVLPRSRDPKTGQPLTTLIRGPIYQQVGSWQRLQIDDVGTRVQRQANLLRFQHSSAVDAREAYVDKLVLNAYAGPGLLNLWVDEILVEPHVAPENAPRQAAAPRSPASSARANINQAAHWPTAAAAPHAQLRVHGPLIESGGQPFFARIIEHNGESLDWLKSLGFQIVRLRASPSRQQMEDAERLDMWFVAPPPHAAPGALISDEYDRVLAWSLGERLATRDLAATRKLAGEVRAADDALRRPTVCSPLSQLEKYGQIADIVLLEEPSQGAWLDVEQFTPWLRRRARMAGRETPFWASIATEPADALRDQIAALDPAAAADLSLEAERIRLLIFSAIAAGARGLYFQSRSRLDGSDRVTRARARLLELLNHEISLIEPWAAGGSVTGDVEVAAEGFRVSGLQTDRSRLLVALRFSSPDNGPSVLAFKDAASASSSAALRVADGGLQPIQQQNRNAGGVRVQLNEPASVSLVLIGSDYLAQRHLNQHLAQGQQTVAALQLEIAADSLEGARLTHGRLRQIGQVDETAARHLQQADADIGIARRLQVERDHRGAARHAQAALRAIGLAREAYRRRAAHGFSSAASSPFCANFDALPLHWRLAGDLQNAAWTGNVLAAGDFENLDHMKSVGWRQHRATSTGSGAAAELTLQSPRSGRSCLRIYSWETGGAAETDAPPIWIESAPVRMRRGQLARIEGWVNVRRLKENGGDGFLIFDSFGGPALAERVEATVQWAPFSLYRSAPRDGDLTVTFSLAGAGEVRIDDVSVSVVDPPRSVAFVE